MSLFASAAVFSLLFLFLGDSSQRQPTSNLQIESTKGFLEICAALDEKPASQSPFELFKTGYFVGWMNGFTTGILGAEAAHSVTGRNPIFCPPEGNSFQQMVHITRKYIADHPEEEHLPTGVVVVTALHQAFPCGDNRPGGRP